MFKETLSVNPVGGAQTLQLQARTPVPSDLAVSYFCSGTLLFSGHTESQTWSPFALQQPQKVALTLQF